ncbi:MAG: hypothetical protein COV60_00880 [Candidatus Magasanikbacteria bacterium CG11_big_fil_rev_8_21_14_0_20_43_7]|uniref:Uncharacterized protein n=1 Tax=Candidatus Magasanikbacteria bacterium CG11_big_fil_rev_8_21_14_0_20_43_7 TaxID=1974654 RepID=A0A2H0N362_9BACT|nr:MAG: hypothetical protein COV60_00880 [Candidatus Magasanikbacteria bacterium CG11_big_fil_rev_8_21_14_0_20_43_7]
MEEVVKQSRADRAAIKALEENQKRAFDVIVQAVTTVGIADIADIPGVCRAIQADVPCIYLFTCLGTYTGRQELKIDIRGTSLLSSRRFGCAKKFVADLAMHVPLKVKLILPDAEPLRVWGWDIGQDELTTACELMIEQAADEHLLPGNWQAVTWTSLEADAKPNSPAFEDALTWATQSGQMFYVRAEAELMSRHSYITTHGETLEVGRRLAAHLAYESALLASFGNNGILLHVDGEGVRREKLLAGFRPPGIPVIHGIDVR